MYVPCNMITPITGETQISAELSVLRRQRQAGLCSLLFIRNLQCQAAGVRRVQHVGLPRVFGEEVHQLLELQVNPLLYLSVHDHRSFALLVKLLRLVFFSLSSNYRYDGGTYSRKKMCTCIYSSTRISLVHVSVKYCGITVTHVVVLPVYRQFLVYDNPSMLLPHAPPLLPPPPPAFSPFAPLTGGTGGPCLESWTGKPRTQPKWTCGSRRSAWVALVNKCPVIFYSVSTVVTLGVV